MSLPNCMLPNRLLLTRYLSAFALQEILCVVVSKVSHCAHVIWLASSCIRSATWFQSSVLMSQRIRSLSVSLVCLQHMFIIIYACQYMTTDLAQQVNAGCASASALMQVCWLCCRLWTTEAGCAGSLLLAPRPAGMAESIQGRH